MGIFGLFAFDGPPSVSAQTDTTAPTVSSIAITSEPNDDTRIDGWTFDSGVYGIADSIQLTVTFNEDVIVTGGPQLELDIGGSAKAAAYESADGSNVVFSYTVAEGYSDTDGIAVAANKLTLSGGCIEDPANNDVDLSNSAVTAQAGHKVDGVKPSFRSLSLSHSSDGSDGFYQVDDELLVRVRFSEQVIVNGNPQLTLNLGDETKLIPR